MKVNPLPPQAYTKETLQKAYTWLLNQSASVKDLATTQDMLISLYLKAQRSGDASLETPSIQNFKQELKSLATMIGDLQATNPIQTNNTSSSVIAPHVPTLTNTISSSQSITQSTSPSLSSQPSLSTSSAHTESSISSSPSPKMMMPHNNNSSGSNASLGQLDLQSLQILSDVRHSLNLSSDIEVLRMLISLGYKQVKKMNS